MKSKILVGVIALITIVFFNLEKLSGQQVTSSANDTGWINVTSYGNSEYIGAFTLFIGIHGASTNFPKWSLLARVNTFNINSGREVFDLSNKIRIRLGRVEKGPSIQDIGTNQTPVPLSSSNSIIFHTETAPINPPSGSYGQFVFHFDIVIDGGAHLATLKDKGDYRLNLTFSIVAEGNQLLTESNQAGTNMRINPIGLPPQTDPTYSIQVNSAARNGLLELKTMRDYVEGVSQTYTDGLSVNSTTDYAIQVRSLNTNFEAGSNSLPLDAVSLELKDRKNNGGGKIALSETAQTVFNTSATGKNARLFDIRYFTKANDERLINAKPASYQTTLMYTLVPQ